MFKSYLKIAFRTISRNKLVSFINVFGLGLGMSIGLMVMIRLQDQLSYDRFEPNRDRIARVISTWHKPTGEELEMHTSPVPLASRIEQICPSVEKSVTIIPGFSTRAKVLNREMKLNGAFASPDFFSVFGFSFEQGSPATALAEPGNIVLTKETARKYFGKGDPMGQQLVTKNGDIFKVTGVLAGTEVKSHLQYGAYLSASTIYGMADQSFNKLSGNWSAMNAAYTYVLLKKGSNAQQMEAELGGIARDINGRIKDGKIRFTTEALADITPGSWGKFYFEMGIALVILLAACFNYTNLTTARALTRAKEVGIRKINGATRAQVFYQYIMESTVLSLLALCFAWFLMGLIIQYAPFNDGYEFVPSSFRYNPTIIFCSVLYALLAGVLAGVGPATILSSFSPVRVLKNLSTARILGKVSLQKTLIVFQYSLSLVVIIFLFGFYRQFSFMSKVDPGFRQENVLVIALDGIDEKLAASVAGQQAGVSGVSGFSTDLAHGETNYLKAWLDNATNGIPLNNYYADQHFIDLMKLKLVAGTPIPPGSEKYIILNQQASMAFGFKKPELAIGQMIHMSDSSFMQVAGVVQNFHFENPGIPIGPMAIRSNDKMLSYLFVATNGGERHSVTEKMEAAFKKLTPASTVTQFWLDEEMANGNSQAATVSLLGYIAFMAMAIATLGLTGLVIYTVEIKRKQISIRKVLGAGKGQILKLLSGGFVRLLVIAGLIGIPIGYTGVILFLQFFSIRTPFNLLNPIGCYFFLLSIGLITILSQTWKAAGKAPVEDLARD